MNAWLAVTIISCVLIICLAACVIAVADTMKDEGDE